jgi:dihydroxyacid dehydratase/phosphogluconate dehydratase
LPHLHGQNRPRESRRRELKTDQSVIVPVSKAFEKTGGLHILRGNLAPKAASSKPPA